MVIQVFLALATALSLSHGANVGCDVDVQLRDGERVVPGWLRALDRSGNPIDLPELLSRGEGLDPAHAARRWFVLPGRRRFRVPCRAISLEAIAGLQSRKVRVPLHLRPGQPVRIVVPMTYFSRIAADGWSAGNTHLHLQKISRRQADRYLVEVPAADGLDVVFVSFLERAEADREYVSNGYGDRDLDELSRSTHVSFGSGEEQRHNFSAFGEGFGHQLFLNVRQWVRPVSIGPGITKMGSDAPPLETGARQARKAGATVVWCHNELGLESIASAVLGNVHALNVFDGDPADHGDYAGLLYPLWNIGRRAPVSTGTDWFLYDVSRVYVRTKAPGIDAWLQGLEAGRAFVTNGPILTLGAAGVDLGDTVALERPATIPVHATAIGRTDFGRLELVRNGQVVASSDAQERDGAFVADVTRDLPIDSSSWLAARVPPPPTRATPRPDAPVNELGAPLFAHTSAIFVDVAGQRTFVPAAAEALRRRLSAQRDAVASQGVFANPAERNAVLDVYARAERVLSLPSTTGQPNCRSEGPSPCRPSTRQNAVDGAVIPKPH